MSNVVLNSFPTRVPSMFVPQSILDCFCFECGVKILPCLSFSVVLPQPFWEKLYHHGAQKKTIQNNAGKIEQMSKNLVWKGFFCVGGVISWPDPSFLIGPSSQFPAQCLDPGWLQRQEEPGWTTHNLLVWPGTQIYSCKFSRISQLPQKHHSWKPPFQLLTEPQLLCWFPKKSENSLINKLPKKTSKNMF